ncbi:MAG TPA: efflux RND transporter periplasmic adaptor subunit [Stellaceae bacterium]|nr:efflux RND transporter periplasmic adaptor subunit [Stellaceae bacterium]
MLETPSQRRLPAFVGRRPLWQQLAVVGAIGALMAVAFALAGLFSRSEVQSPAASANAADTFRPTPAQWTSLSLAPVREVTFRALRETDGKIANNDDTTTPVFSPYSGQVTRLFAKAGDTIAKGAPLMAIAASEFVQAQNDLITALQGLNAARAQLRLTTINETRQHELYEAKAGALKDWEQSQADLEAAKAGFHTAEVALAAVRNRLRILGKSDGEIAQLEGARSEAVGAESIVTAPIGGVVTQRQVGLGQYINSAAGGASGPVYSIGNLDTVWLLANVREADAPMMQVGEPVEVHVLAYPGRVFKAKLTYVAPSIDPNLHRLPVRAEVENSDGALKPEMFATFSIVTGSDVTAPAVPESAVVHEGETARVWVVRDDKSVALQPIRVGRVHDGEVEILAGLKPGETVVAGGSLFIDRAAKTTD